MTNKLRTSLAALALLIVAVAVGIASAGATPVETAATKTVTVGDNFFSRSSTSIKRNDSVRFKWNGTENRHNVNVRSGPVKFKSKTRTGSYSYTRKFATRGSYKLNCTIHPDSMKTAVKVK